MGEPAKAYVAHRTSGRLRLRVPSRRGDMLFFEQMRARLSDLPDIISVEANPATAGFLLRVRDSTAIEEQIEAEGLLTLLDREALERLDEQPVGDTRHGIKVLRQGLTGLARGRPSFGTLVFVSLLSSGLVQLARGNVLAPAASLFWYASNVLQMWGTAPGAKAPQGPSAPNETGASA